MFRVGKIVLEMRLLAILASFLGAMASSAAEWKESGLLAEAGFQHAGTLDDIVVLPDGERVLTSSRDGGVRLFDIESGKLLNAFLEVLACPFFDRL